MTVPPCDHASLPLPATRPGGRGKKPKEGDPEGLRATKGGAGRRSRSPLSPSRRTVTIPTGPPVSLPVKHYMIKDGFPSRRNRGCCKSVWKSLSADGQTAGDQTARADCRPSTARFLRPPPKWVSRCPAPQVRSHAAGY